ncbi:MAG: sulfatase-like hydrolase/transferase, partial [Butyrivibrio sp.]|nr:sulfatase-like hydrolase/transferase [Butyrivibrio sp.]
VTMQNHGGYTGSSYQFEEPVKVTNFEASESLNNYLSLIKMSDSALKRLIEYFENVDEPTIIVMYGDHQPSFDDETKLLLSEHPAWEDEQLQAVSGYYVPYIIWANYDIDEVDNLNKNGLNKLSTNYLGTTTLKLAGLELSDYDKMLDKISEETPAITAIGVWDKDGNYYSNYALAPNADKLLKLNYVQYNMILDKNNQKWNRFVP